MLSRVFRARVPGDVPRCYLDFCRRPVPLPAGFPADFLLGLPYLVPGFCGAECEAWATLRVLVLLGLLAAPREGILAELRAAMAVNEAVRERLAAWEDAGGAQSPGGIEAGLALLRERRAADRRVEECALAAEVSGAEEVLYG